MEQLEGKKRAKEVRAVFDSILENSQKIKAGQLFDYNIFLIGMMGVGKSTISGLLGRLTDMEVVEMDQIICDRENMSISDIFKVHGEEYFRNAETELLRELRSKHHAVISCGGGTPMREQNVLEMRKNGRVVFLTAKPETILERVKDRHERPLLKNNKNVKFIEEMMLKRRDKYLAAADIVLETDNKTELEICEELVKSLLGYAADKH